MTCSPMRRPIFGSKEIWGFHQKWETIFNFFILNGLSLIKKNENILVLNLPIIEYVEELPKLTIFIFVLLFRVFSCIVMNNTFFFLFTKAGCFDRILRLSPAINVCNDDRFMFQWLVMDDNYHNSPDTEQEFWSTFCVGWCWYCFHILR